MDVFVDDYPLVLVTGATGFVAGWIIKHLLETGYRVRGTVRSFEEGHYDHLEELGKNNDDRLELVKINLLDNAEKWCSVMKGCSYVCHVASPFPLVPMDEQQLIKPAVVGTLSVLHAACQEASVKRVVITSAALAISAGWENKTKGNTWTEDSWALKEGCRPYSKSKLLAEQAAWEFMTHVPPERGLSLVTILPSFILGPLLSHFNGDSSRSLLTRFLNNNMPGVPDLQFGFVDVRDVAAAHVLALTSHVAANQRYICSAGELWLTEVGKIVSNEFTTKGYKIARTVVPKPLLWMVSWWDGEVASILPLLGVQTKFSNEKIRNHLGIQYRELDKTIIDMCYSLINFGFVPRKN